jgi:CHASE2 domain-containing sensor protein
MIIKYLSVVCSLSCLAFSLLRLTSEDHQKSAKLLLVVVLALFSFMVTSSMSASWASLSPLLPAAVAILRGQAKKTFILVLICIAVPMLIAIQNLSEV